MDFFCLSATLFHNDKKKAAAARLFLLLSVATVFCSLSLLTVSLFPRGTGGTLMAELERGKRSGIMSSIRKAHSLPPQKEYYFNVENCYIQFICHVLYTQGTRSKCHTFKPITKTALSTAMVVCSLSATHISYPTSLQLDGFSACSHFAVLPF